MTTDVWAVYGPSHDRDEDHILEVFTNEADAESWLGGQLLSVAVAAIRDLGNGGQFSLLLTRGTPEHPMSGGWAISGNDTRQSTDFRVVHLRAVAST